MTRIVANFLGYGEREDSSQRRRRLVIGREAPHRTPSRFSCCSSSHYTHYRPRRYSLRNTHDPSFRGRWRYLDIPGLARTD